MTPEIGSAWIGARRLRLAGVAIALAAAVALAPAGADAGSMYVHSATAASSRAAG